MLYFIPKSSACRCGPSARSHSASDAVLARATLLVAIVVVVRVAWSPSPLVLGLGQVVRHTAESAHAWPARPAATAGPRRLPQRAAASPVPPRDPRAGVRSCAVSSARRPPLGRAAPAGGAYGPAAAGSASSNWRPAARLRPLCTNAQPALSLRIASGAVFGATTLSSARHRGTGASEPAIRRLRIP